MWTPDRDAELRRLGVETYISRHPGADVHEVLDRYLLLLDPEGRAALLREKNRNIEAGKWTQPERAKTQPPKITDGLSDLWTPLQCERLRKMCAAGLSDAVIACRLGRTMNAIKSKKRKLGLCINLEH